MPEQRPSKNTETAISLFNDHLAFIADQCREKGLQYSLVGGIAIASEVSPYRENNTQRDIDIASFGPNEEVANLLIQIFKHLENTQPAFPAVGLESAHFSDEPVPHGRFSTLSGMRVASDGTIYMTYRDIETKIPPETLETKPHKVNGVEFDRFPEMTLLLRYLLRGAALKPKDWDKVMALGIKIINESKGHLDLRSYIPYFQFLHEIHSKYPWYVQMFTLFWMMDKATGGHISGAKGKVYDMIGGFRS